MTDTEGRPHNLTPEECGVLFWLAARDIVFFCTYDEEVSNWTNGWSVAVNCNDTFYYACADAESLEPGRVHEVKAAFEKWGWPGVVAWTAIKRDGDPIKELCTPAYYEAKEALLKTQPPIETFEAARNRKQGGTHV